MNIRSAKFVLSSPDLRGVPASTWSEFAFIGRSNVGKSSLINLLTGQKDLAKVSAVPGKTKLINFFAINDAWHLVDLPGYGYAKVAQRHRNEFNQSVAEYLQRRENLRTTFVLIDSRLPPQRNDLEFLAWLTATGAPFVLVFTKTDKLKPRPLAAGIALFRETLTAECGAQPLHFTCSSLAREGRREILAHIESQLTAPPVP